MTSNDSNRPLKQARRPPPLSQVFDGMTPVRCAVDGTVLAEVAALDGETFLVQHRRRTGVMMGFAPRRGDKHRSLGTCLKCHAGPVVSRWAAAQAARTARELGWPHVRVTRDGRFFGPQDQPITDREPASERTYDADVLVGKTDSERAVLLSELHANHVLVTLCAGRSS